MALFGSVSDEHSSHRVPSSWATGTVGRPHEQSGSRARRTMVRRKSEVDHGGCPVLEYDTGSVSARIEHSQQGDRVKSIRDVSREDTYETMDEPVFAFEEAHRTTSCKSTAILDEGGAATATTTFANATWNMCLLTPCCKANSIHRHWPVKEALALEVLLELQLPCTSRSPISATPAVSCRNRSTTPSRPTKSPYGAVMRALCRRSPPTRNWATPSVRPWSTRDAPRSLGRQRDRAWRPAPGHRRWDCHRAAHRSGVLPARLRRHARQPHSPGRARSRRSSAASPPCSRNSGYRSSGVRERRRSACRCCRRPQQQRHTRVADVMGGDPLARSDALYERQVAAEIAGRQHQPATSETPHHAARQAMTPPVRARHDSRYMTVAPVLPMAWQRRRAAPLPRRSCRTRPGPTPRWAVRRADQARAGGLLLAVSGGRQADVQHAGGEPAADREISQCRVEGVAEPVPSQDATERTVPTVLASGSIAVAMASSRSSLSNWATPVLHWLRRSQAELSVVVSSVMVCSSQESGGGAWWSCSKFSSAWSPPRCRRAIRWR